MQTALGILLSCLAVWLVVKMMRQARRGDVDLFSVRNFFLLGFIGFQLTSAAITFFSGHTDVLKCTDYDRTGMTYTLIGLTFLFLFLAFYRWGKPAVALASKVRGGYGGQVGPYAMLVMAFFFLGAALFFRLVLSEIPVFGILALIVTTGFAAGAAGMASWAWAPRWLNPFVGVVAAAIIAASLGLSVYGEFGRRNALSILMACVWGAHHGHWKHIGLRRAFGQVVPLAGGAMVFIAAFTAGRKSAKDMELDVGASLSRLSEGDLGRGFLDMATGQAAGACSMWLVETRPHPFPYDTFHTLRYFLGHPIPRKVWPEKPIGLGSMMTTQSKVKGRSKDFSFGAGIIGHIANDNPWLCLVPYAFGLAFLMRFSDQVVKFNPTNPFVVIPVGVALGDTLGLARGETGLFLSRVVFQCGAAWIGIAVFGMVMRSMGIVGPAGAPEAQEAPPEHGGEVVDPAVAAAYDEGDR